MKKEDKIVFFELEKTLVFTIDDETITVTNTESETYNKIKKAVINNDKKFLMKFFDQAKMNKVKRILKI